MSKGYTSAFAMTAPVAPATANPQGGITASFDWPAIAILGEGAELRSGSRSSWAFEAMG
jgi:hypothetical protein